jgi:Protein of unknown function (DUF3761)
MKAATKYVCWVADLAVALGIWTWLASVQWPASAETSCHKDYYHAASGDCVHRPVCGVSSPPQGATALCNDGCYSFSENADMDETCSRHGGTKKVLN